MSAAAIYTGLTWRSDTITILSPTTSKDNSCRESYLKRKFEYSVLYDYLASFHKTHAAIDLAQQTWDVSPTLVYC